MSTELPRLLNRKTGAIAGVAIATVAGGGLLQSVEPSSQYEGSFHLQVGSETRTSPERTTQQSPATTTASIDHATYARILWSHNVLAPVVEQLQPQYPDLSYSALADNLEVNYNDTTNSFEVNYRDNDPQKVQVVLDQVSRAYLKYGQECHSDVCQGLDFIGQRLHQLQGQIAAQQREIQEFQQRYGVSDPERLGLELSQRNGVLEKQHLNFQVELSVARTSYTTLQKQFGATPDNNLADRLLAQDNEYQEVLNQLQLLANQFATELANPQTQQATVESLKQQYEVLSLQLAKVAQQVVSKSELGRRVASPNANYQDTVQAYTLLQWADTVRQIHTLEISRQLTAEAQQMLAVQVRQWAVLARKYSVLQQNVQSTKNLLKLHLTRRAELQTHLRPQAPWRMVAPPEVVEVSGRQASHYLIDAQHDFRLGLTLCFALVIWGMTLSGTTKTHGAHAEYHRENPQEFIPQYSSEIVSVTPFDSPVIPTVPMLSNSVSRNAMVPSPAIWEFEDEYRAIAYFLLLTMLYAEKMKAAQVCYGGHHTKHRQSNAQYQTATLTL
jgi:hypothetical protein